mgnify:CR=1 FL=1
MSKDNNEIKFSDYDNQAVGYSLEELVEIYKRIFQDLESDKN